MKEPKYSPIVRFAVERRVTITMSVLGVLVLGWLSLNRLPLEFLPSFSSSSITVNAPYPSSSPEEVERLVVRPLEETLGTINGIEFLSASATESGARVRIEFVEGSDMDLAAVEVRDRVERARAQLPEDLERTSIWRFQSSDIPVLRFDLSAEWPETRLFEFAEEIVQRRLERLEGVAQIEVSGLRIPVLQVNIDPARLQAHGIDVRTLANHLRESNLNLSAGHITEGSRKLLVRSIGEFRSPDEVRELPITGTVRVGDVAEVTYDFPEQEDFNFLNGIEAVTVRVNKTSNSNILTVVDRVKSELNAIEQLPEARGATFRIYADASQDVRSGLGQLRNAGLVGGTLAILAVFFFLRRFRTTALAATAIPISVIATFVLIYFMRQAKLLDITLNVVSLAGLMLALGMLVDNSIVVIESIFRHRNELNEDARTAALAGTSEVALPIVASTATTMCVFLPLIFLGSGGGRFRLYLENIGITICIVTVASLVVALTVVPMVAAFMLRGQSSRPAPFIDRMTERYGRSLRFTLRHRFLFVIAIVAMFGGSIWLFSTIERAFAPHSLEREVMIKVDTPRQYSLEQIRALYRELYGLLDRHREELEIADISYNHDRGTGRSRASWSRTRQFNVYLKDESESLLSTAEVRNRIRALLPVRAGVDLRIATSRGRHGSSGVEVELMGDDPAVLELISGQLTERLKRLPMIRDVDSSLESADQEIRVDVQRDRVAHAGLSSRSLAFAVNSALSGRAVTHYMTGDREVDLVMRYREEDRETLDELKNVSIFTGGEVIPLGALADFRFEDGPRSIERENHTAKLTVSANAVDSTAMFGAMRGVTAIMNELTLPPGYTWSYGRWNRYQQRDQEVGMIAWLFALPLIYMLLAALFESFAQPFTIMFSVPFSLIGVAIVMKLAAQPWDTMAMIGMIVLMGVVVNNAIVLINHINHLRGTGMDRDTAIVLGGRNRLRPILITAITTILGLAPMVAPFLLPQVFGPLEGRAASWAPIGLVIVGGLTTSTFLTLMIIPTIYSLVDDVTRFFGRVFRAV